MKYLRCALTLFLRRLISDEGKDDDNIAPDPIESEKNVEEKDDANVGVSGHENEIEIPTEDFPEIRQLPYTRKRIQQNLKNINFEEDSDEDWNINDKTTEDITVENSNMVKILRKRCNYVRYNDPDISSDEEDVEVSIKKVTF